MEVWLLKGVRQGFPTLNNRTFERGQQVMSIVSKVRGAGEEKDPISHSPSLWFLDPALFRCTCRQHLFSALILFFFLKFLWPHPRPMDVLRPQVESEQQLWQRWSLNPQYLRRNSSVLMLIFICFTRNRIVLHSQTFGVCGLVYPTVMGVRTVLGIHSPA